MRLPSLIRLAGLCSAAALLIAPPAARARPITIKGSNTIGQDLGPELARAFEAYHPGWRVAWEGLGSKTGFLGLLDGSAEVGASSRQVQESEYKEAQRLGVEYQEYVLGFDGIALAVHPRNTVPQLTLYQLSRIFQGKVENWKELGGADAPVKLYARPSYSGTRSIFDDKVLRQGNPKGPEQLAASATVLETNEQIIARVALDPGAVAYVGMGSLTKDVRAVPLTGAAGEVVLPEVTHVRDGSYPLYRALYLYTRGPASGSAAEILRFIFSPDGQRLVAEHGFVPLGIKEADQAAAGVAAQAARPAKAPRVEVMRIHFAPDNTLLSALSKKMLAELAARTGRERRSVLLVGHTDRGASLAEERRTALDRAQAVSAYLAGLRYPKARIEIRSAGADEPIASNETPAGRESNRRVDLFVLAPGR
ncbi:MAG TPA: phosphate ABC transporter substrate-binding/OmpA family protein [Myxococcales bacterium]|jgi:phosphate transport system substrate-binding protein|nr:phosphate ABC transporter substrate-binding/OmpA family protein [Myxococcales bacterium]